MKLDFVVMKGDKYLVDSIDVIPRRMAEANEVWQVGTIGRYMPTNV